MEIKILVAHHKVGFIYKDNIHEPIHVGKELSEIDLGILGDNTSENISHLNPFYCELTATYWAWKNVKTDYVGICHYRRYFCPNRFFNFFSKQRFSFFYYNFKSFFFKKNKSSFFLNQFKVHNDSKQKLLESFSIWLENNIKSKNTKIFALKPVVHLNKTNFDLFSEIGIDYIQQLKECVKKNFPEYNEALELTLKSNELHYANMIIMEKFFFNEYCQFVFGVLEKHFEINQSEVKNTDNYSRVSGYMGELLTNTYLMKKMQNGIDVKLLTSLFIES